MKLYAPKYYNEFVCIADKCRHSCCIGWEIDVDDETAETYEKMTDGYGLEIKKSLSHKGTTHFKLKKDDRCPHLDENGLCKIILNIGEDSLCAICREHPRFYNYTARGKEVGLGMSCEEACEWDFDAIAERESIFTILSLDSLSHGEKLQLLGEKYSVSPALISDDDWRDRLSSLEYLDDSHKSLFACYSSASITEKSLEKPLERALAYFVFRHCSTAEDPTELRAALGFSLFCERLLASVCAQNGITELSAAVNFARIISEELEYSEENTDALTTEFYFC